MLFKSYNIKQDRERARRGFSFYSIPALIYSNHSPGVFLDMQWNNFQERDEEREKEPYTQH